MAYQTGSASDLADLLSDLMTFAVANGWTQDQLDTGGGSFALHKNSIYASGRWDTTSVDNVSLHQALGYSGGSEPGAHTDDSGNGYNSTSAHTNTLLDNERCIYAIGDGPFPSYHFFEQDADPAYLHVVVEIETGVFRHFGFGELSKLGDWTGGEYVYGHYRENSQSPIHPQRSLLLDGLFVDSVSSARRAATLHMEGLAGMGGSSKWGQIWGNTGVTPPDDSGSNAKVQVQGGYRAGPVARGLGIIAAGAVSGLVAMYPVLLLYRNGTSVYPLGWMPDVRGVNIANFAPGDEITISSDTWIFFPQGQKTASAVAERTYNSGIAYKKVTA